MSHETRPRPLLARHAWDGRGTRCGKGYGSGSVDHTEITCRLCLRFMQPKSPKPALRRVDGVKAHVAMRRTFDAEIARGRGGV